MPIAPNRFLADLTIVIPSAGRHDRQITLEQLPARVLNQTYLAIPKHEQQMYKGRHGQERLWSIPDDIRGISGTRNYIMQHCKTRYVAMLDDDMVFAYRQDMSRPHLTSLQPGSQGMLDLLVYWRNLLDRYAHVGLSARQGNNRETREVAECRRMFNAYMYDREVVLGAGVVMGRLPVMEDFDLTLQLLRKGFPNAMIYKWCWNQGASNLPGGCSTYRTTEMQAEAAHKLAQLHPGFVKVVNKKTKNWIGMEDRVDVTIYWSKAYASSKK